MRQGTIFVVVVGLVVGWLGTPAWAQRDERRRNLIEDALRVLVETQVLPHLTPDRQPGPPPPPRPGGPRPGGDPRHREIRRAVEEFAADAGELVSTLRRDEQARPEIRPLLGDAIAVKALSDALLRRAEFQPGGEVFSESYPAITQRWRSLSLRLEGSFAVSATCRELARKLDASDRRICQALDISPEVDREAAVQLLAAMSGHLRSLQEEIATDARHSRDAQLLMLQTRQLQIEANSLTAMLGYRSKYDDVVGQYGKFYDSWKTLAERLRVDEYRSAGRRIRSIRHLHNELHELLWIPRGLDRAALAYAALELQRNLQTLCEQVSLKTLLTLPDGATVLKATRELQTMCADFATSAARNDTLDSLRWDFRPLDVQWQQYRSYFQESAAPNWRCNSPTWTRPCNRCRSYWASHRCWIGNAPSNWPGKWTRWRTCCNAT